MRLFNKLFGSSPEKDESAINWIDLNSMDQLHNLTEQSKTKTQIIFKHSTRCGISSMVKRQFEKHYNLNGEADLYYLDILNHRDISNEIAKMFEVYHESPQILIIRNGKAVKYASHGAINDLEFNQFV